MPLKVEISVQGNTIGGEYGRSNCGNGGSETVMTKNSSGNSGYLEEKEFEDLRLRKIKQWWSDVAEASIWLM